MQGKYVCQCECVYVYICVHVSVLLCWRVCAHASLCVLMWVY